LAAGGVTTELSAGALRSDEMESVLLSLCRPIRPSFSMAMKLVRTLDSGRGDSEAAMAVRQRISSKMPPKRTARNRLAKEAGREEEAKAESRENGHSRQG